VSGSSAGAVRAYYVQHAITFFPDRFAAAIVADPSSLGLFNYLMGHGWSPLLDQEYETFNEGMPVGEDLTRWLEIRCSASTAYARH